MPDIKTAAILTVGDELLNGQITDTNSAWIAAFLEERGWRIMRKMSAPDETGAIVESIRLSAEAADLVIITGGLGPTHDDLTLDALSGFFQVEKLWHEATWQRISDIYRRLGREPAEIQKTQCYLPANAEVIDNDHGTAPGTLYRYDGKVIVSMPGVPGEMKHLLRDKIIDLLPSGLPVQHRYIRTAGEGETVIAEKIADLEAGLPPAISLAYLPAYQQVTLRLTTYDQAALPALDMTHALMVHRLGAWVYSTDTSTLSEAIGHILRSLGETLATAESCTGGYLAHLITQVAGSSDYFLGSIISYANAVKTSHLDVPETMLNTHGAVSREVAEKMATAARGKLGVTWALSTTGVAGPGGGTPGKPAGTIWIACAGPQGVQARLLNLTRDRLSNIEYASLAALVLLRKMIMQHAIFNH